MKQRLIVFLKHIGKSQAEFQEFVGLSNGFVNNVGDSIRTKSLNKIKTKFPELNTAWLQTGQGEMLLNIPETIKTKPVIPEKLIRDNTEDILRIKASLVVLEQMVDLSVSQQTGKSIGIVSGERKKAVAMETERLLSEFLKKSG